MFRKRHDVIPLNEREPLRVMFMINDMSVGGAEMLLDQIIRRMDRMQFRPATSRWRLSTTPRPASSRQPSTPSAGHWSADRCSPGVAAIAVGSLHRCQSRGRTSTRVSATTPTVALRSPRTSRQHRRTHRILSSVRVPEAAAGECAIMPAWSVQADPVVRVPSSGFSSDPSQPDTFGRRRRDRGLAGW